MMEATSSPAQEQSAPPPNQQQQQQQAQQKQHRQGGQRSGGSGRDPSAPGYIELNAQELRELKRVFERLCDFHARQKLQAEVAEVEEQRSALVNPTIELADDGRKIRSLPGSSAQVKEGLEKLDHQLEDLRRQLNALDSAPNKKIKAVDISHNMSFLGKKTSKKEVLEMIWEVDENLDGCVDWEEFRLMFLRNVNDTTGLEPSKLYNMVQFMVYDGDSSGSVSVDETMNMLYARYGRARMEAKLRELFGGDLKESGKQGGEISFVQYLESVERTQLKSFLGTNLGKTQLTKLGKKAAIAGA